MIAPPPPRLDQIVEFLHSNPLCARLSSAELAEVIFALHLQPVARAETVITQGTPGDAWYFVYDGSFRVEHSGRELAIIEAGGFFGEMSVLDDGPRTATVVAISNGMLLRIATSTFNGLLDSDSLATHKLALELTRELARRMRAMLHDDLIPDITES